MSASSRQRAWLVLLVAVPILLIVLAYAWMAIAHGTPMLWNVVVHEGGEYTLGQTVLFVRHHLREVPVDIAMSLALAASITMIAPGFVTVSRRWFLAAAVLMFAIVFAASAAQEGWLEAGRDLLQFRTRDDDVQFGSHWRFHFLSTIWFCVAAPLLAGITTGASGPVRNDDATRRWFVATWLYVGVLTLLFGVTAEPFTSARYIGHQAREILTHGILTLPLVFAGCLLWYRASPGKAVSPRWMTTVASWLVVAGIPLFLVVAFSGASIEGTAQLDSGLSGIVAAHVFEHLLDYAFVALLTLALLGRQAVNEPRG